MFWQCETIEEVIAILKDSPDLISLSPFVTNNTNENWITKINWLRENYKGKISRMEEIPFNVITRNNGLRQQIIYIALMEGWAVNGTKTDN